MKKIICITWFLILILNNLYCQDVTNDIIYQIKNQIEKSVFQLHDHKSTILQYILDPQKSDNPESESYLVLKPNNLAKVFIFDEYNIMVKEISYQNGIFSSKLLNYYNVALSKSNENKIYLSPLFLYKNKPYYMLGIKNDINKVLFLFNLNCPADKKFALFNQNGEILFNSIGFPKVEIEKKRKNILENDSEEKEKLIEKNGVKVFLPNQIYFIFE